MSINASICILSLGRRGGCVEYALNIISNLKCSKIVYCSSMCEFPIEFEHVKINTYNSRLNFVLNSFIYLPLLILKITKSIIRGQINALYIPYFHHWNFFIILLCKIYHIPVITTIHDGILHTGDGEPLEQNLNIKCIRNSDHLIFLTNYTKELIIDQLGLQVTSSVVPHGIFSPRGLNSSARYFPKDNFKILFIGRISKYKGVELLVDAFNLLPKNLKIELIIAGKPNYELDIHDRIGNNVKLIFKYLSEEDIVSLLNYSSILVLPYLEATQSGVATLGIAASLPIVCTDVGGLREQLVPCKDAVFCKPDKYDIANTILKYATDKHLYESISLSLNKKAEELGWEVISDNIHNIIMNRVNFSGANRH